MKKSTFLLFGAASVAASIALVFALSRVVPVPGSSADPRPILVTSGASGAVLYADNCASCHGANLEGAPDWQTRNPDGTLKPPPHDATGHTWHHTDTQNFTYTKLGGDGAMAGSGVTGFVSGMPAFEGVLSDAEIRAVLDYIKSSWPENIREAQAEMSRMNPD